MKVEIKGTCSPAGIKNHIKHKTCMAFSELVTIGAMYNSFVDKAKKGEKKQIKQKDSLPLLKITKSEFASPARLIKALNERFSSVCSKNEDHCWIEQPIFKQDAQSVYKQLQSRFRPLMPSTWIHDKNFLLNTFDIYKVLKQYEDRYADFEFLGVFPLDFMEVKSNSKEEKKCIIGDVCHFQIKKHINDKLEKKQFALVHNMDPHDQPGSHWVSLYMNIDQSDPRFGFSYYDSYGLPESYQVKKLYKAVVDQLGNIHPSLIIPFQRNKKRNQYKNTECGMFSILFVVLCLENKICIKNVYKILDQPSADDRVAAFREKLFRKKRER